MPSNPKQEVYASQELHDQVREYAEECDVSVSAAWRELARRGLQAEEYDDE